MNRRDERYFPIRDESLNFPFESVPDPPESEGPSRSR